MPFPLPKYEVDKQNNWIQIIIQLNYPITFIKQYMNELYQRAWRGIVSPSKLSHQISNLCPKQQLIQGKVLERIDFNFCNKDNKKISGVILKQQRMVPDITILYLHGNGGSKLQCLGFVPFICKNNVAIIGFDFIGCGNSDQGYLTYGINESQDAFQVINQVKKYIIIKRLTVWGRSMGAVTAIMMAQKKKILIDSLVLDSPFQNLLTVIQRVIKQVTQLPKSVCYFASYLLSQQINKKLSMQLFSINYLQIYKHVGKIVPTLFFYSQNDRLVLKDDVLTFYNFCKATKNIIQIYQQHQDQRNPGIFLDGIQWIKKNTIKKLNKLKLSYMTDGLQIDYSSVKSGRGFCCCTKLY